MSDSATKAAEYRKQADKKLKSLFGGLFGNNNDEAAELLEKAGSNFKVAKAWPEAAEAYIKLAEVQTKMESKHDAAAAYVEAAKATAKFDAKNATGLLHKAVSIYTDMGRLNMAARQLREIGEVNEKQGNKDEAITFYLEAADLFETEGSTSEATKCRLKVAEFSAELGNYKKAAQIYEEAARRAVENNLLKYSARGYLLQSGICLLCFASLKELKAKLAEFQDLDLQFPGSRDANLLEALIDALEQQDDQAFATALAEFDSITRLDPWKTKLLLVAKRRIQDMQLGVGKEGETQEEQDDDDDGVL